MPTPTDNVLTYGPDNVDDVPQVQDPDGDDVDGMDEVNHIDDEAR